MAKQHHNDCEHPDLQEDPKKTRNSKLIVLNKIGSIFQMYRNFVELNDSIDDIESEQDLYRTSIEKHFVKLLDKLGTYLFDLKDEENE